MVYTDDCFLQELMEQQVELRVFIINGFQMRGTIVSVYQNFILLREDEGRVNFIGKAAISTLSPIKGFHCE